MEKMRSQSFILFFSVLIFLLNPKSLRASGVVEYNGKEGKENQIYKVSGVDDVEEKRAMVLEKVRYLLGMRSFMSTNRHLRNGFSSPSPAPSVESQVPAPAPAPAPALAPHPMAHSRLHYHSPRSSPRHLPVPHELEIDHGRDKARVKNIVIAVAVSGGVALVLSALGFLFICGKVRRNRKRGSKCVSSSNKVSFDLGPEHFYLNTLELASQSHGSFHKNVSENVNIISERNHMESLWDEKNETGRQKLGTQCDTVSEEVITVREIVEQNNSESDVSNCSVVNKILPIDSLSSDDESFHSVCDSPSSNGRMSDASLEDRCEPPSRSNTSSSLEHSCIPPHDQPSRNSPTSFLSTLGNPRETESSSMPTSIPPQHVPPPPPPPPPPPSLGRISPSQFSSRSTLMTSRTSHSSTMSNISSPRNSDSSSGSNAAPQHGIPSAPQKASGSIQGGAKGTPPPPPCPPFPPNLPPSMVKGRTNSLHPPPPPPGLMPHVVPVGKDGAPLPKLKPLHWDKVRATPDRSMVWDKMRSSSFEFDEQMIESLFGYNLQSKNGEAMSKSPSPSKHVLEPKRLQNITILSKALNATPEQICQSLIQGEGLSLQQLEALGKMVPTIEEAAKLSNYQGDINELGSAEKFVKSMLNVPFAFVRVEAMLYRDTFEDEVTHLRKSFAMLEEACKELRSSRLFLKLLEAVLKTGNRMNVGTIRGGAIAFKLDALLKLADVKGTDGKTTLLHFVVQEMIRSEGIKESDIIIKKSNEKCNMTSEEKEEDYRRMGLDLVSGLSSELCNVKKTATIDLDVLASSVSTLSDGMVKLQHLVYEDLSVDDNKRFVHSMRRFLTDAEKSIKELQKDENSVLLHVQEITEYFHGNVSKDEVNPLRIFVIVRDFLGVLDQVCKEVRTMKIPAAPNSVSPFQ